MSDRDDLFTEIAAEREITRVIQDYPLGVDQRDFERVRACFHADAEIDVGSFRGVRDDYVAWLAKVLPLLARTQHAFGPPSSALCGDGAEVETHCLNANLFTPGKDGASRLQLLGLRYLDHFERCVLRTPASLYSAEPHG